MADPARRGHGGKRGRRRTVDPARSAAYDVVAQVRTRDAYANLALPAVLRQHHLSGRDAAFATELAAGTLRRRAAYDAIVDACLDRPRLEPEVRDVLRLGLHQLLSMRVPPHAAISTSVDLTRARVGPGPAGLVNAVLRRASASDLAEWTERLAPDETVDPIGHAALVGSHPRWVTEVLAEALGARRHELADLLAADNDAPEVALVSRPGVLSADDLLRAAGEGARPGALSPYAVYAGGGDPGRLAVVADGRAGVQDEGSQVVALALAGLPMADGDRQWLDLCAGPGGKTALLAALAAERGGRVLANEVQPRRAVLVARAARAVPDGMLGVVCGDGTHRAWRRRAFDRVLVDAPCTGLGALRRRPEARWRRTPADLEALVPLQTALLESGLDSVRPGGVVVYATCSPVLAETAGVVEAVLAARGDVRLEPVTPSLPNAVPDAAGPLRGTVQLWPHRHGTDAMFMAALRRV